jgi:hypothetical protein
MSFVKSGKSEDTKGVNSSHKTKKGMQNQGQKDKNIINKDTTNKTRD